MLAPTNDVTKNAMNVCKRVISIVILSLIPSLI